MMSFLKLLVLVGLAVVAVGVLVILYSRKTEE